MKLSKQGLRGVLFYYAMIFIGVGLFFFTEAVPEEIWAPIFIVGGLVMVTIFGYKLGVPSRLSDKSVIEISRKGLFRRRPDTVGELIGQLKAAEKTAQERAGKLFAARNRYGEYGYIGYARETVEHQLKSDSDKSWFIEETMMIPLKEWDEIRHAYQERFGDEQAERPRK